MSGAHFVGSFCWKKPQCLQILFILGGQDRPLLFYFREGLAIVHVGIQWLILCKFVRMSCTLYIKNYVSIYNFFLSIRESGLLLQLQFFISLLKSVQSDQNSQKVEEHIVCAVGL